MTTKKEYLNPYLRVCRCTTEQGFAISAESGLPSIDDDWTNKDYE